MKIRSLRIKNVTTAIALGLALSDIAVAVTSDNACGTPETIQDAARQIAASIRPVSDAQLDMIRSKLFIVAFEDGKATVGDTHCPRRPIDRLVQITGRPAESLLTVALASGDERIAGLVKTFVVKSGGSIFLPNEVGSTPYEIAQGLYKREFAQAFLPPLDDRSAAPGFWDRLSTAGTAGPVLPDTTTAPSRAPAYVSQLISTAQGVSIGSKLQEGKSSPQVQGELRYGLQYHSDLTSEGSDLLYLFLGGNVSKNKDPLKPTTPDWLATGVGYKFLHDVPLVSYASPGKLSVKRTEPSYSWAEATFKAGILQNRIPIRNEHYAFVSAKETVFFPLWPVPALESIEYKEGRGVPMYGSVTIGTQIQQREGGNLPATPRNYSYVRFDAYAFPCWAIEACRAYFTEQKWGKSSVTMNFNHRAVNHGGGRLNELQVGWEFRKKQTITLSRSIGNQDPLINFGVPLIRSALTQLQLKLQN